MQRKSDLVVRVPAGDTSCDVTFAGRQSRDPLLGSASTESTLIGYGSMNQLCSASTGYHCVSRCGSMDGIDDSIRSLILEQVSGGTGQQHTHQLILCLEAGHRQYSRIRLGDDRDRCLGTAHSCHPHIHEGDVRPVRPHEFDRLRAIRCLTDDLDRCVTGEDEPKSVTDERLIVNDEHAHARMRFSGGHSSSLRLPALLPWQCHVDDERASVRPDPGCAIKRRCALADTEDPVTTTRS